MKQKLTIYWLGLLVLCSSSLMAVSTPETESNNTFETANTISFGDTITGAILGTEADIDWFAVTTTENGALSANLELVGAGYVYINIYDNNGVTNLAGGGIYLAGTHTVTFSKPAAGDYYIRIHYYNASSNVTYNLTSSHTPPSQAADAEPNDSYLTALSIPENSTMEGNIGYRYNGGTYDTHDWYVVETTQDGELSVTVTNPDANYYGVYIYDNNGATMLANTFNYGSATATKTGLQAGTYYILVYYYSATYFGGYELANTLTPTEYASDTEPNNTFSEATVTVSENDFVNGHIGHRINGGTFDTDDWYMLTLTQDGAINLTLVNNTGQYNGIYLYDDNGTTSLGNAFNYGTSSVTISNLAAGNYYARVYYYSPSHFSGYQLNYNVTPTVYDNDVEPNNSFSEATVSIPENGTTYGHIGHRLNGGTFDANDWYMLTLSANGAITLKLNHGAPMYHGIYLYDSNGTTSLGSNFNYDSVSITVSNLAAGNYFARVYHYSSSHYSGYQLDYMVNYTAYGDDVEPNDDFALAVPIQTNSTVGGNVGYRYNDGTYDQDDYYMFTISEPGDITITTTNTTGSYNILYLYNSAFVSQGSQASYGTQTVTKLNAPAGTYYARLYYYSPSHYSAYQFTNNYCPDQITIVATGETTLCEGESVVLSTPDHHLSYLWNDGSTTETNTATLTGEFSLTIDNGDGCEVTSNLLAVDVTPNPVAVIDADGPTEFCEGGSVTLSVTVPTADSYLWSTGETTSSIVVTESGDYTVELFKNDCSAISDPIAITVNPNPTATITPAGPTTFCEGGSVTLNANAATSYLWNNGATSSSIVADASGSYSVTITDANGCTDESSSVSVTENANPVAAIEADGDTEFCEGSSVNLTASGGTSYLWSNGATSAMINVTESGDYSCTVTNAEGCSDVTDVISVTVNPNPEPVINADGPTTFCEGGSVNLSVDSFFDILWSTGATTESINITASGSYSVTVTDANGCSATSGVMDVSVIDCTELTIIAEGDTEFCAGGSVTLTSNEPTGNVWSTGETTQSIVVSESGDYSCTNGEDISNTISVVVNANPEPVINADGPTTFCEGGSVNLSVDSFFDIFWSTGETTESINVTESGAYSVTVTDGNGCTGVSEEVSVTVESCGTEITISAEGPTEFCAGGSVTLTSSAAEGNIWSTGETTQSIEVTESGDYSCSNGEFVSNTISVNVVEESTISVAPVGPDKICYGGIVLLTATASAGDIQWYRNGVAISGANSSMFEVTEIGLYSSTVDNGVCPPVTSNEVQVTYYKGSDITPAGTSYICPGGSVILSAPYSAAASYQWYRNGMLIPGAESNTYEATIGGKYYVVITKGGCGRVSKTAKVVVDCRLVAEQEITSLIYPNPANSYLTISSGAMEGDEMVITLFDMSGRIVLQQSHTQAYTGEEIILSLQNLANGLYNVQLLFQNGTINQHSLVINK